MPRTSTGHPYRVRQGEDALPCVVCETCDGEPSTTIVMKLEFPEESVVYAFPVCSLSCMMAWTELLGRVLDGDVIATMLATAYMRAGRHNG